MLSYQVYKIIHFLGLFMVVAALGGQILHAMNGGTKDHPSKKWLGINSGVGLLVLLVGGFGMLARLGSGVEFWVMVKLGLWVILGFIGAVAIRKPQQSKGIWVMTIGILCLAVGMAIYKP